jgi:hypothetical protein
MAVAQRIGADLEYKIMIQRRYRNSYTWEKGIQKQNFANPLQVY